MFVKEMFLSFPNFKKIERERERERENIRTRENEDSMITFTTFRTMSTSSFYVVVVEFRHDDLLVVNVERRKRDLFILKLTNQSITLISNNEG